MKWKSIIGVFLSIVLLLSMSLHSALASSSLDTQKARYIVQLHDSENPNKAASHLAEQYNIQVSHVYKHALKGFSGTLSSQSAAALRNNPKVKLVEQDIEVHTTGQTLPTGINRIEADNNSIAKINNTDEPIDIDIAILDTGIDTDHPDLNVYKGRNFSKGPDSNYDDGNGHGTHVAGTAAAIDNNIGVVGVAPGARLWAVRVLDNNGSGWLSEIIAGIDWVTENADEIEVANMSLGGQGLSDSFHTAIKNSVAAGVFYAVAAGNSTDDVYGADGTYGTSDDYLPASYPEVATISALSDTDGTPGGSGPSSSWGGDDRNSDDLDDGADDSFAWFSNFSSNVANGNPVISSGAAIDLMLPGVDIYSTVPGGGYDSYSGTSMASPHATGLAALHYALAGTRDLNEDGVRNEKDVYFVRQALIDEGKPQSDKNGLTHPNDLDGNLEYLGWAADGAPKVSWVNPKDGDTVKDTVAIQIEAADNEDSTNELTVEWRVDGSEWTPASYNASTGYFEDSLDTTTLVDGEHTLDARATDSAGNTTLATITVWKGDQPPTVSWVNPKDGDSVNGTVAIQIEAADNEDGADMLTVEWRVDSDPWKTTATYNSTSGYFEDTLDTKTLEDGTHLLEARATDSVGNVSTVAAITINVNNNGGSQSDMYVWDITFTEKEYGNAQDPKHDLTVTVTIKNDSDADGASEASDEAVAGAVVYLTVTNDSGNTWEGSAQTNSSGDVSFLLKNVPTGEYTATVTNVTHDVYVYNSDLDVGNPFVDTIQ